MIECTISKSCDFDDNLSAITINGEDMTVLIDNLTVKKSYGMALNIYGSGNIELTNSVFIQNSGELSSVSFNGPKLMVEMVDC